MNFFGIPLYVGRSTRLFEKEGLSHDIRDRTSHFIKMSRYRSDVGFKTVYADTTINCSSNEGKTHRCDHTDLYSSGIQIMSMEHVFWCQKIFTLMN